VGVQALLDSLGPGVEFARRCLVEFTFPDRLGRSFGDAPLERAGHWLRGVGGVL
jgi:hypothetical protein